MPGFSIARDHGGSSPMVTSAMAGLVGSISQGCSTWGRCGDVVGTFAANVPTINVPCSVSVADAVGTVGTWVALSGHLLILFSLSPSISSIDRKSVALGRQVD